MSFVDKIKCLFNIGGVSMSFQLDRNVVKHQGEVKGKLEIASGGERHVKKIHFILEQREDITRGDSHTVKYHNIGTADYNVDYQMKANDKKTLEFTIPFVSKESLGQKATDALANKGGLLSFVGAVGSFVQNAEIKYMLKVKAEVQGTLFNPEETTQIKLL